MRRCYTKKDFNISQESAVLKQSGSPHWRIQAEEEELFSREVNNGQGLVHTQALRLLLLSRFYNDPALNQKRPCFL